MNSLANITTTTRVERGLTSIAPGQQTVEVIPSVDMTKSIILVSCASGAGARTSSASPQAVTGYARLISNTEVEVKGGKSIGGYNKLNIEVSWEVLTND